MKSSTYYFHMKTKILLDFQIYISLTSRFYQFVIKFGSQPAFTFSKLTIDTLKQGVKYIQSDQ